MAERLDDDKMAHESDIDARLKHFESIIDKNDPEQVKMLEEMKKHTSMLHHTRGDWNKPNTFRHWNEPAPAGAIKRIPLESETYREYKEYTARENTPLLEFAGEQPRLRIMGTSVGPGGEGAHQDVTKPREGLLEKGEM